MFSTLITIGIMSTIILIANNYMLEAIYKAALSESKSRNKITN